MSKVCRKLVFTKRGIEALPANPKDSKSREVEYRDIACVGLTVRIAKNSRRYFQYRFNFNKRKFCISIGEFPAVSVEDARNIVNEYKLIIARGLNPAIEKKKTKADLSFAEFYPMYLEFSRHRIKTHQDQKYRLDKLLQLYPAFGKKQLDSIITPATKHSNYAA